MTTPIKRAILIAAGRGKRLGSHTDEVPKSMVAVGAQPILGWVWKAFAAAGIEELVVIRGYRGDVLEAFVRGLVPRAIFVDNGPAGSGIGATFTLYLPALPAQAGRARADEDVALSSIQNEESHPL